MAGYLEPVLVRVLFPAVFVQVFVQVLVEFLVLFRHCAPAISVALLNVTVENACGLASSSVPMGPSAMAEAARLVRRGGVIVYPTDTVYGLGCDPFNEAAVERLFEAKGRGSKPVPVLCESYSRAEELVVFSPKARELARANWPGALTIVAPLKKPLPSQLTQGSLNLGVRVPSHSACLVLIGLCGGWLTGTSANISGRPSARTAHEAIRQIGHRVDMVLDGGPRGGKESTVVQVVDDEVTILRTGPVGVGNELRYGRTS